MNKGKAYLVGAGPGDEKLITVRGMELLKQADVIIYDRLANPRLLRHRKEGCELIYVGKAGGHHSMKQEDISQLIVSEAQKGKQVVRLKGGDPYVFGRGGEEGELLYDSGIPFEVVPGITAGIGGLAYAGIPVTHRDYGSSFHLITAHKKSGIDTLDYQALSALNGTLVFYMGVENLPNIVRGLLKNGKDRKTKVGLISWASYAHQKTIVTDLEELSKGEIYDRIKPPVLIVVGNVVEVRDKLNFFEKRPLHGKRVVVTRATEQASSLTEKLQLLGAEVIESPAIGIRPIGQEALTEEIKNLSDYTHLVFTSQNGVRLFMEELMRSSDVRALAGLRLCSIGEATSEELRKYSLREDLMPRRYIGEELAKVLIEDIERSEKSARILIPRASSAREVLVEMLSVCPKVEKLKELKIYETRAEAMSSEVREKLLEGADAVTFTSASSVRNFFAGADEILQEALKETKMISIGPITSQAAESLGKKIAAEAEVSDIDGLTLALCKALED